jgi:hypothetical protein
MRAIQLEGGSYCCYGCDTTYVGEPFTRTVLDDSYSEGTALEDVGTYTVYQCHDGYARGSWAPCDINEDGFETYDEAWKCGNCDAVYGELGDAIACCQ